MKLDLQTWAVISLGLLSAAQYLVARFKARKIAKLQAEIENSQNDLKLYRVQELLDGLKKEAEKAKGVYEKIANHYDSSDDDTDGGNA